MSFLSIILSLFISVAPSSIFICDDIPLQVKIINNENGDFKVINDTKKIDLGAFIVIDGEIDLMLPRTFINNEISFSDNKWKWLYREDKSAQLIEKRPNGKIKKYECSTGKNKFQ